MLSCSEVVDNTKFNIISWNKFIFSTMLPRRFVTDLQYQNAQSNVSYILREYSLDILHDNCCIYLISKDISFQKLIIFIKIETKLIDGFATFE